MYRFITEILPRHKPIILTGARGVGKTSLTVQFASKFSNAIRLDLETAADRAVFGRTGPMDDILQAISFIKGKELRGTGTLIVLDEITRSEQALAWFSACAASGLPKAATDLLQMQESKPVKGSPLIIATSSVRTYELEHLTGAGQENLACFHLHPLSFEEFLIALDDKPALTAFREIPVPFYAYEKLLDYFHLYTLIGGMPAVVNEYCMHRHLQGLNGIYNAIESSFTGSLSQVVKSAKGLELAAEVLQNTYPFAAERISFNRFGNIDKGSRELKRSFESLERLFFLNLIHPYTASASPARPDRSKFPRLQMVDTGLVNYFSGIQKPLFQSHDMNAIFEGQIARQVVGQEIGATASFAEIQVGSSLGFNHSGPGRTHPDPMGTRPARDRTQDLGNLSRVGQNVPGFWIRSKAQSTAMVDFVIPFEDLMIPVMVRSGEPGRLRSLHQFVDSAPHPFAVRLSSGQPGIQQCKTIRGKTYYLLSLPYFLAGKIREHLTGFRRYIETP